LRVLKVAAFCSTFGTFSDGQRCIGSDCAQLIGTAVSHKIMYTLQ